MEGAGEVRGQEQPVSAGLRQGCPGRAAGPGLHWPTNRGPSCSGWATLSGWPLGEAAPRASAVQLVY